MDRYYGKQVDPRRFKQSDIRSLEQKVETKRDRSHEYKASPNLDVTDCPICGATERTPVLEMYGISWMQCTSCTHVYQPETLSQDALIKFYESNEEYAATYTDEAQLEYRLENITKPKFDFVLDTVDIDAGRVLDVGCGNGSSVQYLESVGWEATGLEVSDHSVQTAADYFGVELHQQTLEEYSKNNPDAEFDVIAMFGYIDLIKDPIIDLQLASELLADDGYIALHVPQYDSISLRTQQTFPDRATRVLGWNLLHIYTEESLETAFSETGFEMDTAWYYGLDFYELLTHLCLTVDGFIDSELYEYCMTHLNEFQEVIDRTEMSDYVTFIAQKT